MASGEGHVELDRAIDSIRVGARFRRDLGDLDGLCQSIQTLGLLQPVTITPDGILVCGARRLAAVQRLGWRYVKVWVTSKVSTRLLAVLAEQDENTLRKPFTPTEAAELYGELKRLYAEDAARRQAATQFGGKSPGWPGGAESVPPAGKARRQAAVAVTGRASDTLLEQVTDIQRLAGDPTAPDELRETARRELAAMDADGTVNRHYLTVKAAEATTDLRRVAADPNQPEPLREAAERELHRLDGAHPSAELVRAARAALARATTTGGHQRATEPTGAPTGVVRIRRYGLRAFLMTVEEMDHWWEHYDPAEIAAGLNAEQWERFRACLAASTDFAQAVAQARGATLDQPGSAVGF